MREYRNGKKATDLNKEQVGAIYRLAKSGEIRLEKWVAKNFYDIADYYGYDDNRSVESAEFKILKIVDAAIAGDIEKVQELVDKYTEATWALMGRKGRERASRELVA